MRYITNPNFIYIGTFTVPFLVYLLGWSTLYPALSPELLLFYMFTFGVCFLLGFLLNKYRPFKFSYIPISKYNGKVIMFIILFFIVDCIYEKRVPLLTFSSGEENYQGGHTFGIPTLHLIMVTFTLFYSLYVFHQYISNKSKRLFFTFLLTLVPFIMLLQRSNIMYILIGAMFIYVISLKKLKASRLFIMGLLFIAFIYGFGYLGNLRSGKGDSTYIPRMSGVTSSFLNGPIPNEFYWGYLYIASPVASLQYNINVEQYVHPELKSFIVYEMLPDFINNKVSKYVDVHLRLFHQLNDFLNVGTTYANAFSYLSWPGLFIMFFYLMSLMNYYYILSPRLGKYKVTGVAMMFNLIAFSNFSNAIQFSAFSVQLIFPIIFTVIKQFRKRPNRLPMVTIPQNVN